MNRNEYDRLQSQFSQEYSNRIHSAKDQHQKRLQALDTIWQLYRKEPRGQPDQSGESSQADRTVHIRSGVHGKRLANGELINATRIALSSIDKQEFTTSDIRLSLPNYLQDHLREGAPSIFSRVLTRLVENGELVIVGTVDPDSTTRVFCKPSSDRPDAP